MDPDSPVARVGRTFWTVWCYITDAVNRFLRPEAADAAGSDPDPFQDSSASSEPPDGGHTEESAGGGGHHGERPLAPAPLPRSSGVVGWDSGLRPAGKHTQSRTRQREDAESKASEEQETEREEAFGQTGSDDKGQATAGKDEEEDGRNEMYIPKQAENEEHAKTGFLAKNDAMIEDMKGSRREEARQWAMTPNTDAEKREEVVTEVKVNEEDEQDLEEVAGALDTYIMTDHEVTEEGKVNKDGAGSQGGDADTGETYGDASRMSPENDNESDEPRNNKSHVSSCAPPSETHADADVGRPMAPGSGRDNDEEEGHVEGVSMLEEREQENTSGPAHKQTMAARPEQEDGSRTDTGGSTQRVICSEEVSVNATKDLHTEEEQEDVAAITQTNICETDCVNAPATHLVEDHGGSEEDDKGSCESTSVTVKPEAETPQEASREPENPPLRMCEGRAVVSPGPHSAPCEETQEGVPEYNNEPGPDEDQAFLEVGEGKETQTTQLPEEVESLQNGGSTAAAEDSVREESREPQHVDELQDRVQPLVEQIIQKSRVLSDNEEGNSLVHSMKTGIEDSEKEFEAKALLADAELHLKTEELSAEREDEERAYRDAGGDSPVAAGGVFGFTDEASKPPDAELLKTMNPSVFHESWDENSNMIFRLMEDDTKSGSVKESTECEPQTRGDCTEGPGSEPEEGAAQDEMQNKMHGGILDVTAEPIKVTGKNGSALPADVDEAFEMSIEETLKVAEAADDLIITGLQSKGLEEEMTEAERSFAEATGSGHEGAIDEEILDLWIQAVSTEDTDQIKQREGPEEPPEKKEQLFESYVGEPGLVSDVSPFTAESGFLEQLLEFTGTKSFQDNYDVLASESETADMSTWSKPQTVAVCQDAAETEQSDLKEDKSITGFNSHSEVLSSHAGHQEPYKSQGGSDGEDMEMMENDTRSQKEADGITDQNNKSEEADADLQTNGENAEESEVEIKQNETEPPESGSDLLLEEKITSHTQVGTWAQAETLFELPSLQKAGPECTNEELEHPVNTFEVDGSSLDFTAQRSRIALKNPRARPPRHPRSLLHMPSLEPTPSSHVQVKVPAGGPLGGQGVGIKLPGLGAGFPVLKKTRVVADENSPESSREPETKPEDNRDLPKQEEVQQRPKWMPPKHPGFGNPLMSELKTKLKKTTKE